MFLRKYQRTKNGKRQTYFALVESRRTERGPRQQIVAHLGELTEDQAHRRQRTALFHTRHDQGHELPLFVGDHASAATEDDAGPTAHDPDVVRIRLGEFDAELCTCDWRHVREHVEVKSVQRDGETYVLARSVPRRAKEKAIRKRRLWGLHSSPSKKPDLYVWHRLIAGDKRGYQSVPHFFNRLIGSLGNSRAVFPPGD